ncbi:MAG: aspartate carbamoyltransferase regulatory subunit [Bacteroidales bacterium]|nr:aspartate carbamoyltransferase regulatory subunit [Bacteroidales bacterium]MDD2424622.1 aspartate carbamoyltransferase regulatory subunit [Bacteroidales bacterium]MDD3988704.1 aspartate carbamoyltransferase regulatory subunit [Bacteroidales bacterium]MDD4639240.1 aspartate carbamoyltransferase regulatory subunit [Bacteroidales bacterium]
MEKHLKVSAIKDGTVLDHIPSDQLFKVIDILNLSNCINQITFGTNLDSKLLGKKAIIKIADRFFLDDEINKIALIAPQAKINIIHDFQVVEKRELSVPSEIKGIVKCMNPVCITNHQPVDTLFSTIYENNELKLLCHYCEKITDRQNLKIISKG